MARPTDEYIVDRFFDYFAELPAPDRAGVITGLRATHRSMLRVRHDEPESEPQGALESADEQPIVVSADTAYSALEAQAAEVQQ